MLRAAVRPLRELAIETLAAARRRPSFALYLAALVLLPVKWLSPFHHVQAGWTDVFIAAAAAVWLVEQVRRRPRLALRAPHYGFAAYLCAGVLSGVFASHDGATAAQNLVIMTELVALAVITSDFARSPSGFRAIALVILFDVALTALLAVVALALFYAGVFSSLLSNYGDLTPSNAYARVAAGFYSAPLLGSFCIFASAVVASPRNGLSRRVQTSTQIVLVVLVVLTLSRAIIGFAVAWGIRWAAQVPTRAVRRAVVGAIALALVALAFLTLGRLEIDPASPTSARYHFLEVSSSPRLETAKVAGETYADHPGLGIGPGEKAGTIAGEPNRAHLTPLNILATMGPLALGGLAFAIAAIWWRRRRPTNVPLWAGLAGLGVDALGQDVEHFRHVWIMLGLADADRAEERAAPPGLPAAPG